MKYASDLGPLFDSRTFITCVSLQCHVLDLAGVWYSESGCHAGAHNPHGNAAGLCQLMPQTLANLGYAEGWERFVRLAAEEQVPWCARYYRPYAGRMLSAELAYLATFLPAYLTPGYLPKGETLGPETVIAARGGRLGWAYSANAIFDDNGDGRIQLFELGNAIKRNAVGPRWDEIRTRLMLTAGVHDESSPTEMPTRIDLGTVWGAQRALSELRRPDGSPWYAGPIDGIVGPITRGAVMGFQAAHGLEQVGYVGPKTKLAIELELAAA